MVITIPSCIGTIRLTVQLLVVLILFGAANESGRFGIVRTVHLTRKSHRMNSRMNYVQVDWVEVANPDVGPAHWAFGLDVQRGGDALPAEDVST